MLRVLALGFHAVNDVLDPVLEQFTRRRRLIRRRCLRSLIYRFYTRKTIIHALSMFYTLIKHRFLTNQSARRVLSIF